ncbi:hypothetical protein SAMN05414139_03743 [Burkholderia sp. D7]|nr:hypothetical protein SAMN05414139_03743 [Burkholderia sp. D7]
MTRPKLTTLKPRLQQACARMAVMQPGSWRTDKQSNAARGYGYAWQLRFHICGSLIGKAGRPSFAGRPHFCITL